MYYAHLKSLGMTPRQIRCLLLEQGFAVSFLGVLPGWALGLGLHFLITGRLISGIDGNPALYFLSWPPFVAAALGTLLTTLSACLIPTLRLSCMTPVQVSGFATVRMPRRKRSSNERTTLAGLALRTTLGRSRWRTALSALSLLLAAVLLSSVWEQYLSFREDIYLSVYSPWDYSLSDGSAYLSVQRYNENNRGITEETVKELKARPEVTAVSALKSHETELIASEQLRQRIVDFYNQPYDETMTRKESQAGYPDWCAGVDRLEQTGEYIGLIVGLDGAYLQYVLDHCPFTSGSYDAEAFASGDYVLAAGANSKGISSPAQGETVELNGHTY
ncbi:MAG: ABC transporter permease, partial [Lachnospiraceae bacterium]|nr:ABC transporter permease [Lachnospiraceae bacterium]